MSTHGAFRAGFAAALGLALAAAAPGRAEAQEPSASATPTPAAAPPPHGLAVLALDGATDPAWALAKSVYARADLRPVGLDEPRARVLAGEAPAPGAPPAITDLAATRAAIHGDDAPSRQLLASIAASLKVRGVLVVAPPPNVTARVFLADTASFDGARYAADPSWDATVASLARTYGTAGAPPSEAAHAAPSTPGPASALQATPAKPKPDEKTSKPFYSSPWFWGAIGAAAFAGGAIWLTTRDNDGSTIHLQVQVPK